MNSQTNLFLILIITFTCLFSCSKNDDGSNIPPNTSGNPSDPGAADQPTGGDNSTPIQIKAASSAGINRKTQEAWLFFSDFQDHVFSSLSSIGMLFPGLTKPVSIGDVLTTTEVVILEKSIDFTNECGGSTTGSITVEDTGDFHGSLSFLNFDQCALALTGIVEFNGSIDATNASTTLNIETSNLRVSLPTSSFSLVGNLSIDGSTRYTGLRQISSTINFDLINGNEGDIFKLENFELNIFGS